MHKQEIKPEPADEPELSFFKGKKAVFHTVIFEKGIRLNGIKLKLKKTEME